MADPSPFRVKGFWLEHWSRKKVMIESCRRLVCIETLFLPIGFDFLDIFLKKGNDNNGVARFGSRQMISSFVFMVLSLV